MAIPPATVLIGDPAASWMGLASSFVLQQDLATARNVVPLFAVDQSSAYLAGATEILRLTLERRGPSLRLSGSLYNLSSQRSEKVFEALSPNGQDVVTPLEQLAHQLGGDPLQRFSTTNSDALKSFTEAVVAQNPQVRAQLFQAALSADPSFGLAGIALAETTGPAALQTMDASRFMPFDQARWKALSARLSNAPPKQQMDAQQAILKLAPNNIDALATLGTMQFLSGDRQSGERLIKQAISLNPSNLALQIQLQTLQNRHNSQK